MGTVKECDYWSVALASIGSFAVVRAVLTYVYWFSVLVSKDHQEKERRQTGPRAERIMTKRLPIRLYYCNWGERERDPTLLMSMAIL